MSEQKVSSPSQAISQVFFENICTPLRAELLKIVNFINADAICQRGYKNKVGSDLPPGLINDLFQRGAEPDEIKSKWDAYAFAIKFDTVEKKFISDKSNELYRNDKNYQFFINKLILGLNIYYYLEYILKFLKGIEGDKAFFPAADQDLLHKANILVDRLNSTKAAAESLSKASEEGAKYTEELTRTYSDFQSEIGSLPDVYSELVVRLEAAIKVAKSSFASRVTDAKEINARLAKVKDYLGLLENFVIEAQNYGATDSKWQQEVAISLNNTAIKASQTEIESKVEAKLAAVNEEICQIEQEGADAQPDVKTLDQKKTQLVVAQKALADADKNLAGIRETAAAREQKKILEQRQTIDWQEVDLAVEEFKKAHVPYEETHNRLQRERQNKWSKNSVDSYRKLYGLGRELVNLLRVTKGKVVAAENDLLKQSSIKLQSVIDFNANASQANAVTDERNNPTVTKEGISTLKDACKKIATEVKKLALVMQGDAIELKEVVSREHYYRVIAPQVKAIKATNIIKEPTFWERVQNAMVQVFGAVAKNIFGVDTKKWFFWRRETEAASIISYIVKKVDANPESTKPSEQREPKYPEGASAGASSEDGLQHLRNLPASSNDD